MRVSLLYSCVGGAHLQARPGYTGRTQKTGGSGCSCHGSQSATLTISGPASLSSGNTGTYTITFTGSTKTGANIAASDGSLAPAAGQPSAFVASGGELTFNSAQNRISYDFTYTPASTGTKTLYASGFINGISGPWNHAPNFSVTVTTLPIQLASFTATAATGNSVLLEWRTVSEINNYGFFVQRRGELETEFTEFSNSLVAGQGTTNKEQSYSYTDLDVPPGIWYYRLRQVDLDGTSNLTEPIQTTVVTSVADAVPLAFALEQNYPNPFNPTTTIAYTVPSRSRVKLSVYSLEGTEVTTLVDREQEPGHYQLDFAARDSPQRGLPLPSGDGACHGRQEARPLEVETLSSPGPPPPAASWSFVFLRIPHACGRNYLSPVLTRAAQVQIHAKNPSSPAKSDW